MDFLSILTQVPTLAVAVSTTIEPLKRILKIKGLGAVVLSVLASGLAAAPTLSTGKSEFFVTFGLVSLAANGLFKLIHNSK